MQTDAIKILKELIKIDSRNNVPLHSTRKRAATEEKIANYIADLLDTSGFDISFQYAASNRPSVIASAITDPALPTLAFEAHLDTVGTEGMTIDPFRPEIKDGKIYGRGACDTKGSAAAMLAALLKLKEEHLGCNLAFIGACAEETGCEGAPTIDLSSLGDVSIIVGEPTRNQPVTAHKSHVEFSLKCKGHASHACIPENGENAIYKMAEHIHLLKTEGIELLARSIFPGLSPQTLSVTMIKGGRKVNIIPDSCTIHVDLRLHPGVDDTKIVKQMGELGKAELIKVVKTPALAASSNGQLITALMEGAKRTELSLHPQAVDYCTDAGVYNSKGYECVVFGPGDIKNAHSAVEYLDIEELHQAVKILTETARSFLS